MFGLKAKAVAYLKTHNVKTVDSNGKIVKLQNAKTVDVVNKAISLGF